MNIRPIHTEVNYKAALRELSAYFDAEPEPGSEEGDRFEVRLTLVKAYEAKRHPIDAPSRWGSQRSPNLRSTSELSLQGLLLAHSSNLVPITTVRTSDVHTTEGLNPRKRTANPIYRYLLLHSTILFRILIVFIIFLKLSYSIR